LSPIAETVDVTITSTARLSATGVDELRVAVASYGEALITQASQTVKGEITRDTIQDVVALDRLRKQPTPISRKRRIGQICAGAGGGTFLALTGVSATFMPNASYAVVASIGFVICVLFGVGLAITANVLGASRG
jgi:hypothetical protein